MFCERSLTLDNIINEATDDDATNTIEQLQQFQELNKEDKLDGEKFETTKVNAEIVRKEHNLQLFLLT